MNKLLKREFNRLNLLRRNTKKAPQFNLRGPWPMEGMRQSALSQSATRLGEASTEQADCNVRR